MNLSKKIWGQCITCGKVNTPSHTCRIRFTEVNAQRLRNRQAKARGPEPEQEAEYDEPGIGE